MTFIGLFLQSFALFLLVVTVLLAPLVTGGYPGEPIAIIVSALLLIVLTGYVSFHRSSYSSPKEESVDSLLTRVSWLKSAALAARIATVGTLVISGGMVVLLSITFAMTVTKDSPSEAAIIDQILFGFAYAMAVGMLGIAAVLSYFALFFVPFFVALPIAATVGRRWKNPGRFLLLRPFNRRYATRPLRDMVRREIAYFGHIYTLADVSLKVPWYVRVPVFLGQSGFLQFRMRKIKKQEHLRKLKRTMDNRWLRNLNWCMSWGKVFAVATIDEFWRACVIQIIPLMDIVFIDISELRDNVLWEVEQCQQLGVADRIIFLTRVDTYARARKYLSGYYGDGIQPPRLFQYTDKGAVVGGDLQSALAETLANP